MSGSESRLRSATAAKLSHAPEELRKTLGRIPCLDGLGPDQIDALAGAVRRSRHRKGAVIIRQGAAQGAIYQIVSGRVRLFRVAPDGKEQNLWVRGTDECFCLSPLDPELKSPFSVECLADTELLLLDPARGRSLLGTGSSLDEGLVHCLGERLGDLARLAESLAGDSVTTRLVNVILDLADRQGKKSEDGITIQPVTQDELAASAGTAREVVSRTLKRLAEAGGLRVERRRIVLLDREALLAAASDES